MSWWLRLTTWSSRSSWMRSTSWCRRTVLLSRRGFRRGHRQPEPRSRWCGRFPGCLVGRGRSTTWPTERFAAPFPLPWSSLLPLPLPLPLPSSLPLPRPFPPLSATVCPANAVSPSVNSTAATITPSLPSGFPSCIFGTSRCECVSIGRPQKVERTIRTSPTSSRVSVGIRQHGRHAHQSITEAVSRCVHATM